MDDKLTDLILKKLDSLDTKLGDVTDELVKLRVRYEGDITTLKVKLGLIYSIVTLVISSAIGIIFRFFV